MNYLAHAFLARQSPELLTGGLLGDFIKGRDALCRYSPRVQAGIALHRAIDRYTDAHPLVQACWARISPARRRFAGILIDVFFDHLLARNWQDYSDEPLEMFTARVYATLWPQRHTFPARLQRTLPWMRADDWLASYIDAGAVDAALRGIARRLGRFPRASVLATGIEELDVQRAALESAFQQFFPALQDFVGQQLPLLDDKAA